MDKITEELFIALIKRIEALEQKETPKQIVDPMTSGQKWKFKQLKFNPPENMTKRQASLKINELMNQEKENPSEIDKLMEEQIL